MKSEHSLVQQIRAQLQAAEDTLKRLESVLPAEEQTLTLQLDTPSSKLRADDPYNTVAAARLAQVFPQIRSNRQKIASAFYANLDETGQKILNLLNEKEQAQLREKQMAYLEQLLSPALSYDQHCKIAQEAGFRHDMVSLPTDALIHAYQRYRHAIFAYVPELQAQPDTIKLIDQRLNYDMAWQLTGYLKAVETRSHRLKTLTEKLRQIINRDDLLDFILEQLRETPGVAGASIGAFVGENRLLCEKAAGLVLHSEECALDESKPMRDQLKAWREERPVWINSISQELNDECLQADAAMLGIRSYGIVPVRDAQDAPQMLLVIYSQWPGFFRSGDKQFFFENLARELSAQLQHIEKTFQGHFAELTLHERQHFRKLLEQGKIEMVYQPIVDPRSGRVVKLESLARLMDGDAIIPPFKFLPAFGTSQLLSLFEQGLDQMCATLKALHAEGFTELGASINLPTEAFDHPQVMYRIYATVHRYNIPPHLISLEILESGALDEAAAISAIKTLKNHGFNIAMDDVGSGESSMLRMKALPLDEIKVDQGFVRPMLDEPEHLDYVDTLIRLAENLNLFCVVEGVENEAISDIIKTLGEAYLQGYGIARPMPRSELKEWIERYQQENGDRQPAPYVPQTLYGWYARHLKRARIILDALPNNVDLIDFNIAAHHERCPMTPALEAMGLSSEHPLHEAHRMFHDTVAELRQKLETSQEPTQLKKQLGQVVEYLRQLIAEYGPSSLQKRADSE